MTKNYQRITKELPTNYQQITLTGFFSLRVNRNIFFMMPGQFFEKIVHIVLVGIQSIIDHPYRHPNGDKLVKCRLAHLNIVHNRIHSDQYPAAVSIAHIFRISPPAAH